MLLETYAAQRLNEQEAGRQAHSRLIAEHWRGDRRTQPASRWAIVRLMNRLFPGRATTRRAAAERAAAIARAAERAATIARAVEVQRAAAADSAWPNAAAEPALQREAVSVEAYDARPSADEASERQAQEYSAPRELSHAR